MSERRIKTIEFDEFQSLADEFIDRSSQEYCEMPASTFFELLFEKMETRVTETIELEGEIVDDQRPSPTVGFNHWVFSIGTTALCLRLGTCIKFLELIMNGA